MPSTPHPWERKLLRGPTASNSSIDSWIGLQDAKSIIKFYIPYFQQSHTQIGAHVSPGPLWQRESGCGDQATQGGVHAPVGHSLLQLQWVLYSWRRLSLDLPTLFLFSPLWAECRWAWAALRGIASLLATAHGLDTTPAVRAGGGGQTLRGVHVPAQHDGRDRPCFREDEDLCAGGSLLSSPWTICCICIPPIS